MKSLRIMFVLTCALVLAACGAKPAAPTQPAAPTLVPAQPATQASAPEVPGLYNRELAVSAFQKGGCGACHIIPGVPGAAGAIGPDLSAIGEVVEERLEDGEYTGKAKLS